MVSEVFALYKSISSHDKSVVTNLKKINDELLQIVTEGRNFSFNWEESRSYQLFTAMLEVLNTYNQLVFITDTALRSLKLKLTQMHQNTHYPEAEFGTCAETSNTFDNRGSNTLNGIVPKRLPQEVKPLQEVFQNIPEVTSKPEVEDKAQFKPQTYRIQYTPTELIRINPCGRGTGPFSSQDKWKTVPTSLLKNYKEKRAIFKIRDSFARRNNENLETLWEDIEKDASFQTTKSIHPEKDDKTSTIKQVEDLLPMPSNGDTISVLVTGYKTVCHFYAQLFGKYSYQFSELLGQMNSSCMVETYTPFKGYPEIGLLLLAKHNALWYRARCLSKEHGQIKVFLVDVGITVIKKMADIAQMKDDFLRFPFYALECVLDGVREGSELLPDKARKFFEKAMLQKRFKALVVESDNIPMRLRMYDDKGLDLCYVLGMYGIV